MSNNRMLFNQKENEEIDCSSLCSKIYESAGKTIEFFESKLQEDGSYGEDMKDISCYFKSPMMFISANKSEKALSVLNYIKSSFMYEDGDFKTDESLKSLNQAYVEYWSYTNGWIIRAANQLNISDISLQGYEYLLKYNIGENGFLTNNVNTNSNVVDVLTVAHHGLINLEMGNLNIATEAGIYLSNVFKKQPNLNEGFYLRLNKEGQLLTQFSQEKAPLYLISTTLPNQLYFMIGYPAAYLALLYKKTSNEIFLEAAKEYLNFSLSCNKNIYQCDFSHKIAWAASIIYEYTLDFNHLRAIEKISNYFINKQKNGIWFNEDTCTSYDQSAEIACWFLNIVNNLKNVKEKLSLEENQKNFRLNGI